MHEEQRFVSSTFLYSRGHKQSFSACKYDFLMYAYEGTISESCLKRVCLQYQRLTASIAQKNASLAATCAFVIPAISDSPPQFTSGSAIRVWPMWRAWNDKRGINTRWRAITAPIGSIWEPFGHLSSCTCLSKMWLAPRQETLFFFVEAEFAHQLSRTEQEETRNAIFGSFRP